MFKCIKRSKAKLQFSQEKPRLWRHGKASPPGEGSGQNAPSPHSGVQANLGPRRFFSCPGRSCQGRPLFSAPVAVGAVLADKGGHRHLVAAAGRGAHSFEGAWGRERREPGEPGSAVGSRPAPGRGDRCIRETRPAAAPRAALPGPTPRRKARSGGQSSAFVPAGTRPREEAPAGAPFVLA